MRVNGATLTERSHATSESCIDEATRSRIRLRNFTVRSRVNSDRHELVSRRKSSAQIVHEQLFYESADRIDQKNIRKSFYSTSKDRATLSRSIFSRRNAARSPSTGLPFSPSASVARSNWPSLSTYDSRVSRSSSPIAYVVFIAHLLSVFDAHQPLAPVLLRDPITMLLQLLMSVPNHLPIGNDSCASLIQFIELF